MSALAGFLEPGESIEEGCAREVQEEAGLTVIATAYHSSQPWPFPSQLMIGLIAEVSDDQARPDQTELESVAWLTRAEARAVLAGEHPTIQAPPPFAIEFEGSIDPTDGPLAGVGAFHELRSAAAILPAADAAMAGGAKSLFDWRRKHGFCANCGTLGENASGGWKRRCPACGTEHFPRVDPVTIMLPVYKGGAEPICLLGRQAAWPEGRMSALAGFLEPGESIEEGCAREVQEEAGLTVIATAYHSSQPWPFPSQLMIGLIAEVSDDQAQPDQTELEAVAWLTRAEARAVLAGEHPSIQAPPPFAIAHSLIKAWVDEV